MCVHEIPQLAFSVQSDPQSIPYKVDQDYTDPAKLCLLLGLWWLAASYTHNPQFTTLPWRNFSCWQTCRGPLRCEGTPTHVTFHHQGLTP